MEKYTIETYKDYLIKNGLDPSIAAQVAKNKFDSVPQVPEEKPNRTRRASTNVASPSLFTETEVVATSGDTESTSEIKPKSKSIETYDFRSNKPMPSWIRDVIESHLAIEAEDAKKAGALGFMARALVIATMPYKDQRNADGTPKESFTRQNGDFKLRIVAGYDGGIPFGIYPRLLMSWVTTEAVRKQSPVIELGDSLSMFLRDVLDIRSTSGGKRGSTTRVSEQMKRLFGSLITAQYSGSLEKRGFMLKNVLIADELEVHDEDEKDALWTPQQGHEAGTWRSKVKLTNNFFQECINNPVPIDLRAFKALRGSPLAMDIYTWLTYRMSYVQTTTRPITWEALMLQFGSGYGSLISSPQAAKQSVLDFKRNFLKSLKLVHTVYPEANVNFNDTGIVLMPSRTHIPSVESITRQPNLF